VTGLIIAIFEKKDLFVKKIAIFSLIFVVLFSGSIFLSRKTSFVKENPTLSRIVSISAKSDDAKARFMVWGMALNGFKEKPILGWGQEGFNFVFNKYFNPGMYNREAWFDRTHNIFLDWLISAGILGFLSYVSLLVLIFFYLWGGKCLPNPRIDFSVSEKAIFSGLVLGYAFHNIFVFDNIVSYLIFFSILAFFHYNRSSDFKKLDYKNEIAENETFSFYGPILLIVFLLTFYFVNWKGLLVANGLIEALKPQGGVSKNLDILEDVVSKNSFANQEVREQIYQMAVTSTTRHNQNTWTSNSSSHHNK
jgi:O-antigen ligase